MTAEQFGVWAEEQPGGRWELFEGELVDMAPERVAHVRAKALLYRRLSDAIEAEGLTCEALIDGVGLKVDAGTVLIPDVMVRCGDPAPDDRSILDDAVIVVEVTSPSTRSLDLSFKLEYYFRLPSVQHYLIVRAGQGTAIHHQRAENGISTRLVHRRPIRLDPPGITLALD